MYPIWEVPVVSGGLVLAFIATFHILPSHLSVGAMWFNIYVETMSNRQDRPELMEFIKRYSLLLLIFSYVFGSITGIGIWFSATVINPRGISALIHTYVWGWATEWCFFIIELVVIQGLY
ncbi:cytochrome c family protein, partial [Candidatus Magnetoovum chiemensis]